MNFFGYEIILDAYDIIACYDETVIITQYIYRFDLWVQSHNKSCSRHILVMYFCLNFDAQSNQENHVTPTKFYMCVNNIKQES